MKGYAHEPHLQLKKFCLVEERNPGLIAQKALKPKTLRKAKIACNFCLSECSRRNPLNTSTSKKVRNAHSNNIRW